MKKRSLIFALAITLLAPALYADPIARELNNESLEVAELIINLSKSIIKDLNPPVTGAERTVTNATITEEGNTRTFYLEGKDVFHTGRVISTYWIRLHKQITAENTTVYTADVNSSPTVMAGRALDEEAQLLAGPLLNSIYDIAEMDLDHRRVILDRITEIRSDDERDPWIFELIGINQVCAHTDLNTFKITLSRKLVRNRPLYEAELTIPYNWADLPIPGGLIPIEIPTR